MPQISEVTRDHIPVRTNFGARGVSRRQREINEFVESKFDRVIKLWEEGDPTPGVMFTFSAVGPDRIEAVRTSHPTKHAADDACRRAFRLAFDHCLEEFEVDKFDRDDFDIRYIMDQEKTRTSEYVVMGFSAMVFVAEVE